MSLAHAKDPAAIRTAREKSTRSTSGVRPDAPRHLAAEKNAVDAPGAAAYISCAGKIRVSHSSTESRKLATIVAIAIISAEARDDSGHADRGEARGLRYSCCREQQRRRPPPPCDRCEVPKRGVPKIAARKSRLQRDRPRLTARRSITYANIGMPLTGGNPNQQAADPEHHDAGPCTAKRLVRVFFGAGLHREGG